MRPSIRLLLVDDEPLYRAGLEKVFSRCEDVRVIGQAANGAEAVHVAARLAPDVILMDVRMPEMDGITATLHILEASPDTRIAMLTASRRETDLIEAVKAGARGYITKDVSIDYLIDAVRRLAAGEGVIAPKLSAKLLEEFAALSRAAARGPSGEAEMAKVTDRERDVLKLLVQGATNRDIARQLVITENTVKVHLRNILEKLHLRNRQQAAAYAISSGLVRLPSVEKEPAGSRNERPSRN